MDEQLPPTDETAKEVAREDLRSAGQGESVEIHPPHGPIHSLREFLLQLIVITAGVLIALALEGSVEWNHNRTLKREARETILREIADNKKEVDGNLANAGVRQEKLDNALRLANELNNARFSLPEIRRSLRGAA